MKIEKCHDRLLDLLRQAINDIELAPEAHVANEKRVDITCSIGSGIRLPIEIKEARGTRIYGPQLIFS